MQKIKPKEIQYKIQFDTLKRVGPVELGPTASHLWRSDPRHLAFLLSRYKFCSKMLSGKSSVLEIGCGDAFGMNIVLQTVSSVHGIDFDPLFINWASKHSKHENLRCTFSVLDITKRPFPEKYDAAYSLDVIEHIPRKLENKFMINTCKSLKPNALFIIGTPNITARKHSSKWSLKGHINLKSADELKSLMDSYFHNTLIFGMNDEVLHTGFHPMAQYLFAIGVGVK